MLSDDLHVSRLVVCRDLLQQNEALRAKEAEQLRLLGLYEAWSRSVKTSTSDSGPANSNDSSSCLPAPSRLERKSKKLLESIRPLATPQPAADVQDTATGPARSGQGVTALRHPEPAAQGSGSGNDTVAATTFQHGHMVGNGTAAAPSPAYEAGEEASSADAHMTRWFNCIKPEDLDYFRTNTAEELASGFVVCLNLRKDSSQGAVHAAGHFSSSCACLLTPSTWMPGSVTTSAHYTAVPVLYLYPLCCLLQCASGLLSDKWLKSTCRLGPTRMLHGCGSCWTRSAKSVQCRSWQTRRSCASCMSE